MLRGYPELDRLTLNTPGVRFADSDRQDQVRVLDPREAIRAGADRLIIGRPITQADDPLAAANRALAETQGAFSEVYGV